MQPRPKSEEADVSWPWPGKPEITEGFPAEAESEKADPERSRSSMRG